ncbi:hypothetical protein ABIE26_004552 [Pedobacter africanus]|uniref:Uncharacterized protein n=1 Tax=Pedobacter africanus TaxID=151894 RepID=A0ACC6L3M3_9SPHI|nr:hypothetical protein [Pedobacter africanus]MDR6785978.1 hypothetical protein [Pedobacter africanus]
MKKFISLIGFLCFFMVESIAGVSISQFAIRSGYTSGDKLVVSAGQPTTFIVDAVLIQSGNMSNTARVTVVYQENNIDTELSQELLNYDWSTGSGIWQPTITATLPAGKTTGRIYLKLQTWDGSNQGPTSYSNVSYGIDTGSGPVTPGPGGGVIGVPPPFEAPVTGAVPLYEYVSGNVSHLSVTYYSSLPNFTYNGVFGYVFTSAVSGTVPLYRFVNRTNGNHFYSTNDNDGFIPGYSTHGIVCYVYSSQVSKSLPVYGHHTLIAGLHVYRYSNSPGTFWGYSFEDEYFYLLQNKQPTTYPLPEEDCAELYQYYSDDLGDHYYTTVKKDYGLGFQFERVLGYVHTIQKPGTVPLYVYYSARDEDHFYTRVKQDYDSYRYEGIVGYVYASSGTPGTAAVHRYYNDSGTDHYYSMLYEIPQYYVYEGVEFYMLTYNH